jgi:hypothetical protein
LFLKIKPVHSSAPPSPEILDFPKDFGRGAARPILPPPSATLVDEREFSLASEAAHDAAQEFIALTDGGTVMVVRSWTGELAHE